jgi:segregation and condensation protein A
MSFATASDTPTAAPWGPAAADSSASTGGYEVRTPAFAGPLELLLHLILREQVDLYEVRLSDIVDGYLAHLAAMDELDLGLTSEFLLIAATLIELKSRRLLPVDDEIDIDEELTAWDDRELLLHRLVECKTFKQAAQALQALAARARLSRPRTAGVDERYAELLPDLLGDVTPDDLRGAFLRATTPKPTETIDLQHVAPIRVSVTDALAVLVSELPRRGRASFRALTIGVATRIDVVVRFLAVLELYKRGMVELAQAETFGQIEITWLGRDDMTDEELADLSVDTYEG